MARKKRHKPLWTQIELQILGSINSGMYPVGSVLPPELTLCDMYGVSRHTIRAALSSLARQGLIERSPHMGTLVVATSMEPKYNAFFPSVGHLDILAHRTPREITFIERCMPVPKTESDCGFPEDAQLICVDYVRRPPHSERYFLSYSRTFLLSAPKLFDVIQKDNKTPLVSLLEAHSPVICYAVKQSIRARTLPDETCEQLHIRVGQPVLEVTRQYVDRHKQSICVSHNYYLDPTFRFRTTMIRVNARDDEEDDEDFDENDDVFDPTFDLPSDDAEHYPMD